MASERQHATLHALGASPNSALGRALGVGDSYAYRGGAPLIGAFPRYVVGVSAPPDLLATVSEGLPDGPARAEAMAVRLRRAGAPLRWGEPELVGDVVELLRRCSELGRSSVEIVRADPSLLTELHVGTWFDAQISARALRPLGRRFASRAPGVRLLARQGRALRWLLDGAFWAGVQSVAAETEWSRLTASSYVALVYHRMAGEHRPGQERLDIAPERFAAHMRLLGGLRIETLSADRQLRFHGGAEPTLPRRAVVVTVDDGTRDCVGPLREQAARRPQLFVPTREVGGSAHWLAGEPVVGWDELGVLRRAGVAIGPHARVHHALVGLDRERLTEEIAGSLGDLRECLPDSLPILAYPNGRHDERVREAAIDSELAAAYTTEKGANGAGTDPYCLKRVSVYGYDGRFAFAWKALSGQAVPAVWEKRRIARLRRGTARPRNAVLASTAPDDALVTLVMPAFSPRRDWLLEAVYSALDQRGCRAELIVVDDGSPEPVGNALAHIDDPRLRVLRVDHGGQSRARNAGVRAARGDYIRFVDCDDVFEPHGTAHLLGLIAGEHDVIGYGATLVCDEELNPTGLMSSRLDGSVEIACLLDKFDVRLFSMLFPRAVVAATGDADPALRFCQDWDYSLRAFEHARVRGDEAVVTRYRRHSGGASWDINASLLGERMVLSRYFERHPEHRGTSLERRSRARLRRIEAKSYQRRGEHWREYALAIGDALRLAPADTVGELARTARALAPGLIAGLRRTAPARGPR